MNAICLKVVAGLALVDRLAESLTGVTDNFVFAIFELAYVVITVAADQENIKVVLILVPADYPKEIIIRTAQFIRSDLYTDIAKLLPCESPIRNVWLVDYDTVSASVLTCLAIGSVVTFPATARIREIVPKICSADDGRRGGCWDGGLLDRRGW